jgi:hypothetical protein
VIASSRGGERIPTLLVENATVIERISVVVQRTSDAILGAFRVIEAIPRVWSSPARD